METQDDVAILNFTQSMPQPAATVSPPQRLQSRRVSRVILTVPHFLRLADVCQKAADQIKEREQDEDS